MAPSSFSSDASSSSGSTRDWIFFVIVMISRAESTRGREEDKEEGSEEDAENNRLLTRPGKKWMAPFKWIGNGTI
jgi:hypothetical protein